MPALRLQGVCQLLQARVPRHDQAASGALTPPARAPARTCSLTRRAQCMSPECRKILSADNLLQAFSAAYVTTGLERARREALVRADGGFDLLMQLHVFPRVHDFEARCADFRTSPA